MTTFCKRNLLPWVMTFCLAMASVTLAQSDDASAPATAPTEAAVATGTEADHEALRELRRLYERAIAENDLSLIKPHLADDFTGVMVTGELVTSYDGLVAYWEGIRELMGEGGTYTAEIEVAELSTIVGDIAMAYGSTGDVVTTGDGKTYQFTSQWTAVCQKIDGQWKILRTQGSMDPVGNPFVKAQISAAGFSAGAIAGIVGLILGIVLALIIVKAKAAK